MARRKRCDLKSVFVVVASTDYEGSSAVRVFAESAEAESFAAECKAYRQAIPHCPEGDDEAEWEAYWKANTAWRENHPAGEAGNDCDYFTAYELPFGPRP